MRGGDPRARPRGTDPARAAGDAGGRGPRQVLLAGSDRGLRRVPAYPVTEGGEARFGQRDRQPAMSFFGRYFAALDGPDPYSSLDMVADDLEFAIEWAPATDRKSYQIRGGRPELRAFIDSRTRGHRTPYVLH